MLLCLLASTCAPQAPVVQPPSAQDASRPADTRTSAREDAAARWSFTLEPFLWLAGIEGDGSTETSPPVDIGENVSLFGSIDGGFLLALEARPPDGRFSLLADGLYLSLADDEGSLRTETAAWMLEAGAGLPLARGSAWEAIAGLRYVDLEFDTEVGGQSSSSAADWIDPWAGLRGTIELGEHWALGLRGDVGGFGVGTQLSWQALGGFRLALGKDVLFDFGYRAIRLDFDDDDLEYDALVRGPFLAFAFRL